MFYRLQTARVQKFVRKWEIIVYPSAVLKGLGLPIGVWKHLFRNEGDNTFVYVCFTAVLSSYISSGTAKLEPHPFPQPFSHSLCPDWGKALGLYTVPCLGMDLVILIFFFVPMLFVSIVKTQGKRAKERGRKKKTSLTEAQSIISQVFD